MPDESAIVMAFEGITSETFGLCGEIVLPGGHAPLTFSTACR